MNSTGENKRSETRLLHIGKATLGRKNMGRAERKSDYMDAFGQAIDIAIERKVDAVISAGRLFQSRSPSRSTVADLQSELQRLNTVDIPFYLVDGPKEAETDQTHLKSLARSGLITQIGGKCVDVTEQVAIYGVDMEYAHAVKQKHIGDVANQFFILVLGDADVTTNGGMIETVESQLPLRPDAILASKRTDPVARIRDGIALLDPGATEYVLSKGTIDEGPLSRGVNEYQIDGGSLSRYRHELDVREFETFRFEMTEETTLDDIEADIETYDLSNVAVLAKLVGLNAGTQSPSRKQIQRLLSDRAYCARVYDERKSTEEENKHNMSESDNIKIADENFLKTLLTMLDQLNNPPQFSNKETSHLVDLYVALSELERQAGSLRTDIRDELSRWIEVGETASGEHGVVRGRERTRQRLKDEETVKTVLRNHGINVETITTRQIDTKKVKDIVTDESLDIEEADVFEVETTEYIRKEDFETNNDTAGTTTEQNKENKTHKVYLGSGTGVKGWIQVDASVVTEEILPLVKENEVQSEEIPTIAVNFSSEVPIRGWTKVDASIVRKKIEPLVRQHRTD